MFRSLTIAGRTLFFFVGIFNFGTIGVTHFVECMLFFLSCAGGGRIEVADGFRAIYLIEFMWCVFVRTVERAVRRVFSNAF